LCILAAYQGFGQHTSNLTFAQNVNATKLLTIALAFLVLCVLFSKVAVADFLLKIVLEKWHRYILWFCMASISVLSVVTIIGLFAQCHPVEMVWDSSIKGTCYINTTNLATVNAAYSTFLDFLLAALPWYFLRKLHMKPKEKIIINLSLSVGIFAGICGTIRVTKVASLNAKSDYTYKTIDLMLWSTTETTVSIMCLCFPTFRPLWRRYVKSINKSNSSDPFTSRERGYQLSGHVNTNNGKSATNTFTVTGGPAKHSKQSDNESADSILGDEFRAGALHGIKQTKSVVIEYEDGYEQSQSGHIV